jgi:hypothetical protein
MMAVFVWLGHLIVLLRAANFKGGQGVVAGLLLLGFMPQSLGEYRISTMTGNLLLDSTHGGDGSAWGKPRCEACHALQGLHEQAPNIRGIVRAKGFETCTGCHGSNGTSEVRRCKICHNRQDLPETPLQTGRHQHDFTVTHTHELGNGECLLCHLKPDMDGLFELDVDLTRLRDAQASLTPYTGLSDFCLRCHNRDHQPLGVQIQARPGFGVNDPLTAIEDDYLYIDRHGDSDGLMGPYSGLREGNYRYGQTVECTDCHSMHGTRNRKLILDDSRKGVTGLSPSFRSRAFRVKVRHGNYADLCVLCHQMDQPEIEQGRLKTRNGLSGVHDVSSDCTECHTHGEAVKGGL